LLGHKTQKREAARCAASLFWVLCPSKTGDSYRYIEIPKDTQYPVILEFLQPIEALKGTDKFLKVPLSGTFKNLSGFYKSAMRYKFFVKLIGCFFHRVQTVVKSEDCSSFNGDQPLKMKLSRLLLSALTSKWGKFGENPTLYRNCKGC